MFGNTQYTIYVSVSFSNYSPEMKLLYDSNVVKVSVDSSRLTLPVEVVAVKYKYKYINKINKRR